MPVSIKKLHYRGSSNCVGISSLGMKGFNGISFENKVNLGNKKSWHFQKTCYGI